MGDVHWWLALVALSETAMILGASMSVMGSLRCGRLQPRLALAGGMLVGLWILGTDLWHRDTVDDASLVIGVLLLALAQGLFAAALQAHGLNRPSVAFCNAPPRVLIVHGPYRLVRHPMYLACVLGFAGGAVLAGSWWDWLVPLWIGGIYVLAAGHEERLILASPLGAAYRRYKRDTGAVVPGWVVRIFG